MVVWEASVFALGVITFISQSTFKAAQQTDISFEVPQRNHLLFVTLVWLSIVKKVLSLYPLEEPNFMQMIQMQKTIFDGKL